MLKNKCNMMIAHDVTESRRKTMKITGIVGVVKLLSMIIIITKTVDSHYFSDVAYCDTYVSLML